VVVEHKTGLPWPIGRAMPWAGAPLGRYARLPFGRDAPSEEKCASIAHGPRASGGASLMPCSIRPRDIVGNREGWGRQVYRVYRYVTKPVGPTPASPRRTRGAACSHRPRHSPPLFELTAASTLTHYRPSQTPSFCWKISFPNNPDGASVRLRSNQLSILHRVCLRGHGHRLTRIDASHSRPTNALP